MTHSVDYGIKFLFCIVSTYQHFECFCTYWCHVIGVCVQFIKPLISSSCQEIDVSSPCSGRIGVYICWYICDRSPWCGIVFGFLFTRNRNIYNFCIFNTSRFIIFFPNTYTFSLAYTAFCSLKFPALNGLLSNFFHEIVSGSC